MVNLVINDHSIRFLELKHANPPTAFRWGERFLPPGLISEGKIIDVNSLAAILEECIDDWKIHKRTIRFIVPDSFVIIRKVSIPAEVKEDEMHSYLFLEIGSSIHFPFEDPVFDIFPLTNHGKTRDILLIAAPEKLVMQYADMFADLQLKPIAADISPLALYRLYYHLDQSKQDDILLTVQFDLTSVSMCIFEDTIPFVMRQFSILYNYDEWETKQSKKDVSYKFLGDLAIMKREFEDIFNEIRKLMDFYRYSINNGKKEVAKFLVGGDHPQLGIIIAEMKERYDLPVLQLDLNATADEKAETVPYKYNLPLGLALKEVR